MDTRNEDRREDTEMYTTHTIDTLADELAVPRDDVAALVDQLLAPAEQAHGPSARWVASATHQNQNVADGDYEIRVYAGTVAAGEPAYVLCSDLEDE